MDLSKTIEALMSSPMKTIETLLPQVGEHLKKLISFEYDDKPLDDKFYKYHQHWLKLLHDYYFRVDHMGHFEEVSRIARREKVILISNHANTLEAGLLGYKFSTRQLGVIRTLVYKEAFRLPVVREIFRSGQCIPISVQAGKDALKENHILVFPEGMDFIKRYLKKDYVVKFHKGFLYIAREYLKASHARHVYIVPAAHDGIDYSIKFWVVNNPALVEGFIKPYLKYPYFVLPKAPIIFPSKTVFNWAKPRKVTLAELETDAAVGKLAQEFRNEMTHLKNQARRSRRLYKEEYWRSERK